MIEDAPGRIDYDEHGTGPTVVLVPGSCSTGAAWRPVMAAWNGQFRCVTTSLLGYGNTVERPHGSGPVDLARNDCPGDRHQEGWRSRSSGGTLVWWSGRPRLGP
jgi:pimeloyl-ACP methyl ester carboxylesterase